MLKSIITKLISKDNRLPQQNRSTELELDPYPLGDIATGFDAGTLLNDCQSTLQVLEAFLPSDKSVSLSSSIEVINDFSHQIPPDFEKFGGSVSVGDLLFLDQVVARTQATHVLEVGTAFGYSAAFILASLGRRAGKGKVTSVDLIDGVKPWAPADAPWASRSTGSIVEDFFPKFSGDFNFLGGRTSLDLIGSFEGTADLGFVDAAHNHPWPLIDILVLCEVLGAGKWIVLQDISLTLRAILHHAYHRIDLPLDYQQIGAQLAYEHWPKKKFRGLGGCFNMAAIQVPNDLSSLHAGLRDLMQYPLENDAGIGEEAREFLTHRLN